MGLHTPLYYITAGNIITSILNHLIFQYKYYNQYDYEYHSLN